MMAQFHIQKTFVRVAALGAIAALSAVVCICILPSNAEAVTSAEKRAEAEEVYAQIDSLQTSLNEAMAQYDAAQAAYDEAMGLGELEKIAVIKIKTLDDYHLSVSFTDKHNPLPGKEYFFIIPNMGLAGSVAPD